MNVADQSCVKNPDLYGASKGVVDLILQAYRDQLDLNCVLLRLSNVYGPGRQTDCAIRTMLSNALVGRSTRFEWGIGQYRFRGFRAGIETAVIAEQAKPFTVPIECFK